MLENIQLGDQHFILHPSGVMFWEEQEILLISDVHLGKISHFRKFGSAVPYAAISENFKNLTIAVDFFAPKIICFLGDLFHSSLNVEWDLFTDWATKTSASIVLVAGNHDIISGLKYEALGIKIFSEIIQNNILLTHHPEERDGFYNICGHLHPGFKLKGVGRQMVKLRCFYQNQQQLIMPAFGEFTGNFWISPNEGDRVFAITKKEVILVY
ncbi:putative phosphoesterase [Gillisia sp. Hel_I_86]|uniref:ligase-associated DNA damage response endonuclease PdeM n=1 Tax=Gillisia sp. Hel_I_86 TaxID=1249981 RepID=UPI0011995ED1|nr:ligase-associated DNA damage response endonuclease PdeM [Gillisia sp. Hel_I_86]TVZ25970.1 putative phosphoesterase [Gillisia sp. Hel_I_86]